jgi:hypothetical protein
VKFLAPLVVAVLLSGCRLGDDECTKACARPFDLAAGQASVRAGSWRVMPEPQRTQAAEAYDSWSAEHAESRSTWMATCVPECTRGDQSVADCRRQATTIPSWKKCQK